MLNEFNELRQKLNGKKKCNLKLGVKLDEKLHRLYYKDKNKFIM